MRGTVAKRIRREVYGAGMPRQHDYDNSYGFIVITSLRRTYQFIKAAYRKGQKQL